MTTSLSGVSATTQIRVLGPAIARLISRAPWLLAALIVLAAPAAAWRWGAFVAGGSDSNCYLTEARLWRSGSPIAAVNPGFEPSWSGATLSMAPTGFAPSTVKARAVVPICPPGLGLIMGGASLLAGDGGAYAVVPLCGALLLWCVFLIASRLSTRWIGCVAAALTLVTPTFLFQLLQPMSDVPAAAFWLLAVVCLMAASPARSAAAGLAAGIALLIRPNLAPLLLPLAWLAWTGLTSGATRPRLVSVAYFAAGTVPGLVVMLALNALIYGAPLRSGYGSLSQLFAVAHITSNLARYPRWLIEICSPWIAVSLLGPFIIVDDPQAPSKLRSRCSLVMAMLASTAVLVAIYLPYSVFDDWTYLRFLLPGIAMLIAVASAATYALLRRLPPAPFGMLASAAVFTLVASLLIRTSEQRQVFTVWQSEARFVDAATWIENNTPPGAVIITIWHSGSVRYYAHRLSLLWDALEPAEFDAVVRQLQSEHRPPLLLLESWEAPAFVRRFSGATDFAKLDWQPLAQIGRDIALYDLSARDAFHRGEPTAAARVFTTAERAAFRRR